MGRWRGSKPSRLEKLEKRVNRIAKPPSSWSSIVNSTTAVPNVGTLLVNCTQLAAGDGADTRSGLQIHAKYVKIRGTLYQHPSGSRTQVRVILARANQQVADSTLSYAGFSSPQGTEVMSDIVPTPDTEKNFARILYDRTFVMGTKQDSYSFTIKKKLGFDVGYNGSASGDIQKNGLYLFGISNEATNTPSIYLQSTLEFLDK